MHPLDDFIFHKRKLVKGNKGKKLPIAAISILNNKHIFTFLSNLAQKEYKLSSICSNIRDCHT